MEVRPTNILLHYYGCTDVVLANAVFLPCWHPTDGDDIVLARTLPMLDDKCPVRFTPYTGEIDLSDIQAVLVARAWSSVFRLPRPESSDFALSGP